MSSEKLFDDQPAKVDKLAFDRYVNAIYNNALNSNDIKAPFVVGLYGPWGSGKSTLIKMLKNRIEGDKQWEVVEFSPWVYRNEKSLLVPLLAVLAKKFISFKELLNSAVKIAPDILKTLSSIGMDCATTGLPIATFLGGLLSSICCGKGNFV